MSQESTRDAALNYLRRGWSVLLLRPRDKRPLMRWERFQNRLATEADVARWLAAWPEANVGIVTGRISSIVVLDVDPKHGGDDSLATLEAQHGPLPSTVEALTGGGGRHLYFLHPGGMVRSRAGLAQGIDLRGDGGYVVAPPSCHPSGRLYAWEVSHHPDEVPLAPLPTWLLHSATGRVGSGHSLTHWRELARRGVAEGERNDTIASFTGHLLWHAVDREVVLELMLAWNRVRCRPPLSDAEVAQVVDSIARLRDRADEESEPSPPFAGPAD